MLFERAVALKKVDELRIQVTTLENVKEELNKENDNLKNENGRLTLKLSVYKNNLLLLKSLLVGHVV